MDDEWNPWPEEVATSPCGMTADPGIAPAVIQEDAGPTWTFEDHSVSYRAAGGIDVEATFVVGDVRITVVPVHAGPPFYVLSHV